MRKFGLMAVLLTLPFAAQAQDKAQTLADIRAQLGSLAAEFNALKAELVSTGAAANGSAGGSALERMDTIEAELMRLTAKTEAVELQLNRVVNDGTNRIGDLEYRLCEVTEGCDLAAVAETSVLGGGTAGAAVPAAPAATDPAPVSGGVSGGAELAMGEQADFDRAQGVLASGDFRGAATQFDTFLQSFPGSPLTQDAYFQKGEALAQLGETSNAARAYLEAFSGAPDGPKAPEALLKLGESLGALGQVPEACVTLAEVGTRYPGTMPATQATVAAQGLACQ